MGVKRFKNRKLGTFVKKESGRKKTVKHRKEKSKIEIQQVFVYEARNHVKTCTYHITPDLVLALKIIVHMTYLE